ncbi:MAG: MFS transporter, partial [Desulfatiglandales bacterium]
MSFSLSKYLNLRLLLSGLMGIVSGLPLMLTGGLLQAYMKAEGVDLSAIGLVSLLGLPYTLKFLWAPFLDRPIPLGRRKGWLFSSQICLLISVFLLSLVKPGDSLTALMVCALLVSFFSANQDIVIDAYRRETLEDRELGLGSSYYIYGYRVGMLISGAGGLILADKMGFPQVYLLMALSIIPFMILTLFLEEPKVPGLAVKAERGFLSPFKELWA